MRYFVALMLFFLPVRIVAFVCRCLRYKGLSVSGRGCKVGFSLVLADRIELSNGARIGHMNLIKCKRMLIGGGKIGHLNFVKGDFTVVMEDESLIHNQNKISSIGVGYHEVYLVLKEGSRIGVKCMLDMTDSIVFGKCSRLAGSDTQIWTHGFVYSADGTRFVRLDAPVLIGDHVYIGTRCTILSGVNISAHITVGACSCVSKSLAEAGLYVGQSLRHLEYDPDAKLKGYEKPVASTFVFRRNGEEYYNYQ